MFLCLALAGLPTPASAQATVQETQVKAAYLAKFASYAEWPEARLGEDASPLVIGVVGADALAADLEAQTRGQAVRGHPIKVRRLAADGPLTEAHVLFIGPMDAPTLDGMFERLRGQPVLTVADSRQAQERGSMITFMVRSQRLRFEVAVPPANESRIRLSALLLTAATRVVREQR